MFKPFAILCIGVAVCAASLAQTSPSNDSQTDPSTTSPVAYVYVASSPGNNQPNVVVGYSAAANGALTAIPGSPFPQNLSSMAVNGKYFMGVSNSSNPPSIDTLQIGSNGTLTYVTSISCVQTNDTCLSAGNVFFDHTGADLYVMEFDEDTNDLTASFAVNSSTGALSYLGNTVSGAFPGDYTMTFFIGDNDYAYSADQSGCMYPGIFSYQRESNGFLNLLNSQYISPVPPPGVSTYYPDLAVADPASNLAILEQPANPPGCANGPLQIAVFTADSSGNLTTNSTYKDMPPTLIASPNDMKMSPSGKLLAVGGAEGLQVFHFNGSGPVTKYTGLLTTDPITQMFWDNHNHLYAISSVGKLYVFAITPTKRAMAPGSPYSITGPQYVIVQPLTR